jgi:hypothetical protein
MDLKTAILSSANRCGIAEAPAQQIADDLVAQGFVITKPAQPEVIGEAVDAQAEATVVEANRASPAAGQPVVQKSKLVTQPAAGTTTKGATE